MISTSTVSYAQFVNAAGRPLPLPSGVAVHFSNACIPGSQPIPSPPTPLPFPPPPPPKITRPFWPLFLRWRPGNPRLCLRLLRSSRTSGHRLAGSTAGRTWPAGMSGLLQTQRVARARPLRLSVGERQGQRQEQELQRCTIACQGGTLRVGLQMKQSTLGKAVADAGRMSVWHKRSVLVRATSHVLARLLGSRTQAAAGCRSRGDGQGMCHHAMQCGVAGATATQEGGGCFGSVHAPSECASAPIAAM